MKGRPIKIFGLVLSHLILLVAPAFAAEYQGKNIDGKKFAAKAYYSETGGVYNVQVKFKAKQAIIYFAGGSQTTIKLRNRIIIDPSNIQGFGRLGQVYLGGIFSAGLNYNNLGDRPPQFSPPEGFWRITLEPTALK